MRVIEGFFAESKEITSLDAVVISSLTAETRAYIKDWPTEAFEIVWEFSPAVLVDKNVGYSGFNHRPQDKAKVETFSIPGVKNFLVLMADGIGWKIQPELIDDNAIHKIFGFLQGLKGEVEGDRQRIHTKGSTDVEKVGYHYEIRGWHHVPADDEIVCVAGIDHIEIE